ncbi:MAG: class I SAM-dependent methyltransferase [Desulfobacteraceae bacterium]|nr:class I SAM-dependent methyltransferase [Desulfobacteraceae bacterium]
MKVKKCVRKWQFKPIFVTKWFGIPSERIKMKHFKNIYKLLQRLILHASKWRYGTSGVCHSCGYFTFFLYSKDIARRLTLLVSLWNLSGPFQRELVERENYFCCCCSANFRKRALAQTVLDLLDMDDNVALSRHLSHNEQFSMYESSGYNVFSSEKIQQSDRYVVSEYYPDKEFGIVNNGVRNENLERLTFPDNHFDVVITSEVLEHVAKFDDALQEIRRVLKPGGYHVFTVPVDWELPASRERVTIDANGPVHVLPPIFHGDTIRDEGILVFRDFGSDVLDVLTRDGFACHKRQFKTPSHEETFVYFARKIS